MGRSLPELEFRQRSRAVASEEVFVCFLDYDDNNTNVDIIILNDVIEQDVSSLL